MSRIVPASSIAIAFTAVAYALCGPTLGLLLCGLFVAGLLIALLGDTSSSITQRLLLASSITDGVALVWLASVLFSPITFRQWLQAYAVLLAVGAAVFSLRLIRLEARIVAAAWIAWFVAPVSLAQAMLATYGSPIAGTITRYHPLFALNRVIIDQGAWTSGDLAYRLLTPLGQDVAYILPDTIWPCVFGHLAVTVVCGVSASWTARARRISTVPC